ncbi:hypothetical protein [Pantoea ananatis]|jgi:hypothetical protein
MTEHPLTLSGLETALLLVCASFLAAAGLYAWLVCEFTEGGLLMDRMPDCSAPSGTFRCSSCFPLPGDQVVAR